MTKRTIFATIAVAIIAGVSIFVACTNEEKKGFELAQHVKTLTIPQIDGTTTYLTIPLGVWRTCKPGWGICNPRYWRLYDDDFETDNIVFSCFVRDSNSTNMLNMVVYHQYASTDDALIISQGLVVNTSISITDDIVIDNEGILASLGLDDPICVPEGFYPIVEIDAVNNVFVISVPFFDYI